jgi:hypothetical protein
MTTTHPSQFYWGNDGSPAELDDYLTRLGTTHVCLMKPSGAVQMVFLPTLRALTSFDSSMSSWTATPVGATFSLNIDDPLAKEEQVIAELYTFPIVYAAEFHG